MQLDDVAPGLHAALAMTGADEEPMHPRVKPIGIAQPSNTPPRLDEGILDGVLGTRRIAKDQASDGVEVGDRRARKLRERINIAVPCPLHEVPHALTLIGRAVRLVSQGMWDPMSQRVPQSQEWRSRSETKGLARSRIIERGTSKGE